MHCETNIEASGEFETTPHGVERLPVDGFSFERSIGKEQGQGTRVQLLLLKHRSLASCVELELTESAIMDRSGKARHQLMLLKAVGVRLAIDDFGTGYSSLSYLQQLPTHVVKIDQSFIRKLENGTREETLVRSIIALSHDLGFQVVAEGVDSLEALQPLLAAKCDAAQRYLSSQPLEAQMFDLSVARNRDTNRYAA